ncbi:uncharacterized protein KGF55_002299 [Candida pseudojiufengensis]|uniref:uncharacterized protein n=1 Tax=Candida pseudojiufengensis TaxID=497109 RepID=UPI0022249343|nr:uncharacterized protein KGF55_002299 [Candida pseudojiufengensis]KAI5964357.1 hypothetical protein KGF55_002299 [Candida pseudojiufengensis]
MPSIEEENINGNIPNNIPNNTTNNISNNNTSNTNEISNATTTTSPNEEWFKPLALDEFLKINELSRANVPDKRPIDESDKLGEYDISCGPILRLSGTLENGEKNYSGSLMLVVRNSPDSAPKITFKIGPSSVDLGNDSSLFKSGEFPVTKYYEEDEFSFYRYSIELTLEEFPQKVQYFINEYYKTNFQFFLPSFNESMNIISYSCNGFSMACDANEYKSSLWLDVLNKHDKQHYHVMLGGGDQIYCDSIKLHSKKLKEWTEIKNPLKKKSIPITDDILKEFNKYYLNHYMDWYGKGFWKGKNSSVLESLFPLAMSQIPSVNIYDDHDIIDGFGSYHDSTMNAPIFKSVGNVAYKYYMLFQHQMNPEEKLHLNSSSWLLGSKSGPFIKQKNHSVFMRLGKEISLLGLDCRTERKLKQVVDPSTYKIVFDKLNSELKPNGEIKHLLVMLGVPIFYPRLVWLEWVLTSTALAPARKLAQKGLINKGLVNEFDGDVEVLDDLNDHWCSKYHKRERNKLVKDLIEFGASKGIRITILSGDVHLCCIGRMKSKYHNHPNTHLIRGSEAIQQENQDLINHPENDPRLIFNIISSAIVNAPPPDAMATLLNKRSKEHKFNRDTTEDVIPIFKKDVDGSTRDNHRFLNKRNWNDLVLANQSITYKHLFKNDNSESSDDKVIRKLPQPILEEENEESVVDDKLSKTQKIDNLHIQYPLFANSIVSNLRVEKEKSNIESETTKYELFIPILKGSYKLDHAPVKHVDD